ncbi:CTLH domain-containing protein [Mycena venus]|uniref:CTLH domain-containing protein n=1 Tax=Mycena venus TaxID=2733690 RepID=A0A8H7CZK9_9AGAR|nr:CTLH domain-containing protein [Mycena venus]
MPRKFLAPVDKILDYTEVAANALQEVATAAQIPFLGTVCTLTLAIIPMVQNARFQQERCLHTMEEIHHSLCALTSLSIHSDDIQAPEMLAQIAQYARRVMDFLVFGWPFILSLFTAVSKKFDSCLRSQQELGTLKRLFKQGEIAAQLDSCEMELRASLAIFTAKQGVALATGVVELKIDTETRHQELLELISSRSGEFESMSSVNWTKFFKCQLRILLPVASLPKNLSWAGVRAEQSGRHPSRKPGAGRSIRSRWNGKDNISHGDSSSSKSRQ